MSSVSALAALQLELHCAPGQRRGTYRVLRGHAQAPHGEAKGRVATWAVLRRVAPHAHSAGHPRYVVHEEAGVGHQNKRLVPQPPRIDTAPWATCRPRSSSNPVTGKRPHLLISTGPQSVSRSVLQSGGGPSGTSPGSRRISAPRLSGRRALQVSGRRSILTVLLVTSTAVRQKPPSRGRACPSEPAQSDGNAGRRENAPD